MTIEVRAAALSWIGVPSGDLQTADGRRWQRYQSGAGLVESSHGTFLVYGAIAESYFRLGGPDGALGAPVTDETDAPDGVGRCNRFEHGWIFWSATTGAHEVHGEIAATWLQGGGVHGRLGYPITDELEGGGYRYQYFQFGALRWSPERRTEHGCPPDRLFGFADTHAHPAAALGFGGDLIHGAVEGDPSRALAPCEPTHGVGGIGTDVAGTVALGALVGAAFGVGGLVAGGAFLAGGLLAPAAAATLAAFPKALMLAAFEESVGHRTHGWPEFDGWAAWSSRTHQQMHLDWVRRSYEHGQRLMVALAVHSEVVAATLHHPQRDMDAAIAQVRFVRELAERHASWMAVARSPEEARAIVASDRLAVILGVEVDALGGLADGGSAPADAIASVVDLLWREGVRYVFPIHLTDNVYGGMALYDHAFIAHSALQRRELPRVEVHHDVDYVAPGARGAGHVNATGLSPTGVELLRQLMAKGMLIDIDHMSWRATDDALTLAEAASYPLVSGHATFHALVPDDASDSHSRRNESRKTPAVLERLRALGSFVGVQPVPIQTSEPPDVDRPIEPDSPGSSTTFARALRYARHAVGGRVAIGSDLNGLARTSCPRFGPGAAHAAGSWEARRAAEGRQRRGVAYRTALQDLRRERLDPPAGCYTPEERDLLRVVIVAESGLPEDHWGYGIFDGPLAAYVRGMRADTEPSNEDERVGYLARTGGETSMLPGDKQAKVAQLRTAVERMAATRGPNPPLARCVTGGHDFDFNLDGLAHYGMLPDLLVDTANLGLAWDRELLDLLVSSETVVQTWEKCTGARARGFESVRRVIQRDRKTARPANILVPPDVLIGPEHVDIVTSSNPLGRS